MPSTPHRVSQPWRCISINPSKLKPAMRFSFPRLCNIAKAALTAKPFSRIPRYGQAVEAGCKVISYLEMGDNKP
jgi:hypothetical protein